MTFVEKLNQILIGDVAKHPLAPNAVIADIGQWFELLNALRNKMFNFAIVIANVIFDCGKEGFILLEKINFVEICREHMFCYATNACDKIKHLLTIKLGIKTTNTCTTIQSSKNIVALLHLAGKLPQNLFRIFGIFHV